MRLAGIALLFCLALAARATTATDVEHFPLIVLENGSLSDKPPEIPLVTIGSLSKESLLTIPSLPQTFTSEEQPRWYTFPDVNPDIIDAIAASKIKFAGSLAGRTVLLLAAPFLNIRQSWIPDALTLQNNTVTLEVTAWDGDPNADAGKNGSCRAAYLLSLAALPQGDYVFHLHCTHVAEQSDYRYRPQQTDDASMPFTVSAAGGKNVAPATLPESALKSARIIQKDMLPEFIPPIHWARLGPRDSTTNPIFQVGSLDAYKYMNNFHDDDRLPSPQLKMDPAGEYSNENLVALINPHIESGDFIRLRSIEFLGRDILITAEYWQDMTPRAAVVPESPFLLIPLSFIPKGACKITLNWRTYQSLFFVINSASQTPYLESPPPSPFKPITIPLTIK